MSEPTTPHRRRTPCCGIEAFRYLEGHDGLIAAEIEKRTEEAVRAYAERLVAAVREMPSGCHDHEGLRCNSDWFDGNCSLIDGAAVIDLIEGSKP